MDEETQLLAPFDEKLPLQFDLDLKLDLDDFYDNENENEDSLVIDTQANTKTDESSISETITSSSNSNTQRHSTPIYQMLERIENRIKAEEYQKKFNLIKSEAGAGAEKNNNSAEKLKDDLWVDKYRPQKFTQLITMDSCNLEVLRWVKQWEFAKDLVSGIAKAEVLRRIDDFRKTKNVNANNDKINNNKNSIVKNRFKNNSNGFLQDHLERPERKILLIHGQPGLGKTTLAHIVAETAGYSVIEINASDERMGNSVITKISSALEVKTSFTVERKPTMIVIDEIDGAAAAGNENNLIKYLVKIATATPKKITANSKKTITASKSKESIEDESDSENENEEKNADSMLVTGSKKKSTMKSDNFNLLHPIICICNDLYVPALRPLRQVAQIIQVKPIGPVQLSLRLKSICDTEGLKINTKTLVDLAEVMDSDVRSTLNALQFLHKKQGSTGNASNFNRELTFGAFKDTVKPPMKLYENVFHNFSSSNCNSNSNAIKNSSLHNHNFLMNGGSGRKYSELIGMIWGSGLEIDRLVNGCFEIYPTIKFFDNATMDRLNAGLEIFSNFDLMCNPKNYSTSTSNGRLNGYLVYGLGGLKELFASPIYSPIKYPKEDYENFLLNSEFKAIFKDYTVGLSAKVRTTSGSRDSLLMERIPSVLNASLPQFSIIKSSNPQLMRPDDKKKIAKSVEILSNEGIALRQIKLSDASSAYKFVLDPPIDRLNLEFLALNKLSKSSEINNNDTNFSKIYDNETSQDSHTYSICRLVAAEMEAYRIRKQKSKLITAHSINAENENSDKLMVSSQSTPNSNKRKSSELKPITIIPKDLQKRVARDFFGRPIAIVSDEIENENDSKNSKSQVLNDSKMTIWYVQNDGVSNAVRRNIKIGAFLN